MFGCFLGIVSKKNSFGDSGGNPKVMSNPKGPSKLNWTFFVGKPMVNRTVMNSTSILRKTQMVFQRMGPTKWSNSKIQWFCCFQDMLQSSTSPPVKSWGHQLQCIYLCLSKNEAHLYPKKMMPKLEGEMNLKTHGDLDGFWRVLAWPNPKTHVIDLQILPTLILEFWGRKNPWQGIASGNLTWQGIGFPILRWFSHANSLRGWSGSSKKRPKLATDYLDVPVQHVPQSILLYYIIYRSTNTRVD